MFLKVWKYLRKKKEKKSEQSSVKFFKYVPYDDPKIMKTPSFYTWSNNENLNAWKGWFKVSPDCSKKSQLDYGAYVNLDVAKQALNKFFNKNQEAETIFRGIYSRGLILSPEQHNGMVLYFDSSQKKRAKQLKVSKSIETIILNSEKE